jgi:hypothetical protein
LAANYIQANLWKIKDSLIKELKSQNENLFETQKLIFNSMQQGIVIISSQYSELEGEDLKFFNTQIRDNFISDLVKFPKYNKKFEKYKKDRGITNNEQIDFIGDPEAFKFLRLKIYTRKVDT